MPNARVTGFTAVTAVTWVDVRDGLPSSGAPVAAAITGRYPADDDAGTGTGTDSGEEFWLVRPMYFTTLHLSQDGTEHRDCFVDSDGVVRLPHGVVRPHQEVVHLPHGGDGGVGGPETVTHWAALPTLPGGTSHAVLGADVGPALRKAWGEQEERPPSL